MEQLITFLQSAWGYCLIGGVSIGSLITMFVLLFKTAKTFKSSIDNALKCKEESDVQKASNTAQLEYFSNVQHITFKLLSYIVMASKMSQDDKITLLNSIETIKLDKYVELFSNKFKELKGESSIVPTISIPDNIKDISDIADTAKSLLDKYIN